MWVHNWRTTPITGRVWQRPGSQLSLTKHETPAWCGITGNACGISTPPPISHWFTEGRGCWHSLNRTPGKQSPEPHGWDLKVITPPFLRALPCFFSALPDSCCSVINSPMESVTLSLDHRPRGGWKGKELLRLTRIFVSLKAFPCLDLHSQNEPW